MANVESSLKSAMEIDGAIGAALVDFKSGMCIGSAGGNGIDMELAAAGNTDVVRAKKKVRDKLGLPDKIEDILFTLNTQYHLIRMLHSSTTMFFYVILDRGKSNLAMARIELEKIDMALEM